MSDHEDFDIIQPIVVLVEGNDTTDSTKSRHFFRKLKCKFCALLCTTKSELNLHSVIVHSRAVCLKNRSCCCRYCNSLFQNSASLLAHEKTHMKQRPHKCYICDKRFLSLTTLKRHQVSVFHRSEHPFRCRLCHLSFRVKILLLHHVNIVHSSKSPSVLYCGKPHVCELCGKCFSLLSALQTHRELHRGILRSLKQVFSFSLQQEVEVRSGESHSCPACPRSYRTRVGLDKHIAHSHQPIVEKAHLCNICGHRFATKVQLRKHSSIHSGEKPHVCDLCGKGFRLASYLSGHKFLHTGERPFQCHICARSFAGRKTLQNHMMIHTGERPFSCELCPKTFNRAETLRMHQRSHTGEQPYECPVCQKRYRYLSKLRAHQKQHFKIKEDAENEELVSILP